MLGLQMSGASSSSTSASKHASASDKLDLNDEAVIIAFMEGLVDPETEATTKENIHRHALATKDLVAELTVYMYEAGFSLVSRSLTRKIGAMAIAQIRKDRKTVKDVSKKQ